MIPYVRDFEENMIVLIQIFHNFVCDTQNKKTCVNVVLFPGLCQMNVILSDAIA